MQLSCVADTLGQAEYSGREDSHIAYMSQCNRSGMSALDPPRMRHGCSFPVTSVGIEVAPSLVDAASTPPRMWPNPPIWSQRPCVGPQVAHARNVCWDKLGWNDERSKPAPAGTSQALGRATEYQKGCVKRRFKRFQPTCPTPPGQNEQVQPAIIIHELCTKFHIVGHCGTKHVQCQECSDSVADPAPTILPQTSLRPHNSTHCVGCWARDAVDNSGKH